MATDHLRGNAELFDDVTEEPRGPVQLSPEERRQAATNGSPSERAEFVRKVPVHTPQFDRAMELGQHLVHEAKDSDHPGGFCLSGGSGSGKTFLFACMREKCRREETPKWIREPLLYIDLALVKPDAITTTLLKQLGSHIPNDKESGLRLYLSKAMKTADVRAIVFDEAHRMLLSSGRPRRKDQLSGPVGEWCKGMHSNRPFAAMFLGMPEVTTLFDEDEQMQTRWPGRIAFPSLSKGVIALAVVDSIDRALPMPEPSDLSEPKIARAILQSGRGKFRLIKNLVAQSVKLASIDGRPRVGVPHLARAHYLLHGDQPNPFELLK